MAHGFRVQIENNLDEWVTGEHVSVPFSQNAHENKYTTHLKHLKDFDARTKDANIVPRIRKHLLRMVRYVIMLMKCELLSYLNYFTGSMLKLTTRVPHQSPQRFRRKTSRLPRRNGRPLFSRRATMTFTRVALELFKFSKKNIYLQYLHNL